MTRIWAALVAVTTGFLATFVVPAAAWAEQTGIAEVVQRRPRIGFGFGTVLCCLVVVGGIVAVIFLISRNRRR